MITLRAYLSDPPPRITVGTRKKPHTCYGKVVNTKDPMPIAFRASVSKPLIDLFMASTPEYPYNY